MEKETLDEIQKYISKCNLNPCPSRNQLDGCGWCYVEHLKDINKNNANYKKFITNKTPVLL